MKNKKKHFITAILATLFLILVLYLIFHDSLGEIKTQLFQADKKALLILVIFGNLYILLDGWVLHYMIVKNREKCTLWQAIRLAYMVVFFNVTTFAAGTKPAQIYDLYQESQIKPGKSFGILTMEYVSHKLTIVLYAAVMLCFFHTVLFQVSGLEKNYLLTGFGVSFAILLFLTMFCINQKFAPWLLRCSDHIKKEKIKEIRKKQDTITGNLITMDQSQIEIEGYGKIPLAKWVPVYKIYGTLEEKTFQDIVIGNMDVQYVVGNGKVQAVLLKEPANIKNIRVLLLNEGSPYYENIYLTSEQKMKITLGKEKREAEAGSVLSAAELLGTSEEACKIKAADHGKIYLTKADGSRETLGYSGSMELRHSEQGYTVVNKISLEDYICGVLPSEMPEKFHVEALKAQAICARSYACMQMVKGDYAALGAHVDDSTNYQVYNKNPAGEKSVKAVEDTVGQVLKYKGNVVEAYYYSTSCGHTGTMENWNLSDDKTYGYLKSVWVKKDAPKTDLSKEKNFRTYIQSGDEVCFDGKTPYFRWSAALDFNQKDENIRNILKEQKKANGKNITFYAKDGTKKKSLKGFGAITEVSVKKRGTSGAVKMLKLKFENGMALVKNEYNIRRILGAALKEVTLQDGTKNTQMTVLPSAYCVLDYDKNTKTASAIGGGFGHGIGMSQYGADGMAQAGYSCDEILGFFYHDVKIESIY